MRTAKCFDPMFFDNLIDSFIFIVVQMHLSLREQVHFSVLNWPPQTVLSDFTLKSKDWSDTGVSEGSININSDFAVPDVHISGRDVKNHWTESMISSGFGRTEHPSSLNTELDVFLSIFSAFLAGLPEELGGSEALLEQYETQLYNCCT